MRRQLLGLIAAASLAVPAFAALQSGEKAPEFTAPASHAGKTFTYSLKSALKRGPVVVYFYPSAYTGGCDLQAHTFAANFDKFAAAGASIVGVSLDSIQRLNDFSADPNYCAGKFPTASDAGGAIAKSYGIGVHKGPPGLKDVRGVEIGHDFADRVTFVVMPDGKIAATIGGRGVAPDENVKQALAEVEHLAAKHGHAHG
ncbi:MAG TPA: peroxiredoxin [Steroidobacteraceae bacterium]|nr:peroxiredoxin [Steroidobacteraceae bacterium]